MPPGPRTGTREHASSQSPAPVTLLPHPTRDPPAHCPPWAVLPRRGGEPTRPPPPSSTSSSWGLSPSTGTSTASRRTGTRPHGPLTTHEPAGRRPVQPSEHRERRRGHRSATAPADRTVPLNVTTTPHHHPPVSRSTICTMTVTHARHAPVRFLVALGRHWARPEPLLLDRCGSWLVKPALCSQTGPPCVAEDLRGRRPNNTLITLLLRALRTWWDGGCVYAGQSAVPGCISLCLSGGYGMGARLPAAYGRTHILKGHSHAKGLPIWHPGTWCVPRSVESDSWILVPLDP